jgi:putative DNA primase/helicase
MSAVPNPAEAARARIDADLRRRFGDVESTNLGLVDQSTTQLLPPDFSDDMLALDFVQAHGNAYRWSPGLGWMAAGSTVWARDDALTRYDLARRICRAAAACATKADEQKRLTSAKTVSAVLSLAQSDQRIVVPATAWDGKQELLNTPGGIVDLRTGQLRHRRPDDYVTQAARVTPDFDYGAELFDAFMLDVFGGDDELVDFMQVLLGYCITGNRNEQMLFFWHGSGANGKSTLLDLVQWLLDTYALKLPAAALMVTRNERHPTELAQLRGRRLAISSELEEGQFWNEALIKELTGDEVMTARFMRQDFFEFTMTQKHIIVGNHKPRLRGGDPAIARRLVLVPFEQKFEGDKRDRQMGDKLKAEAPAILAWIVRGAVRWHREGLQVPQRVRNAGAEYLADHDDMELWMSERCIRMGESKASELYASFRHWKECCGEHAPSMKVWAQRLQTVPCIERRMSNGVRYVGIQLSESEVRRVRYGD